MTIALIGIGFAFEDQFEFFFETLCSCEFFLCSIDSAGDVFLLARDPVTQVGIDQSFQQFVIKLVVIY